MHPKLPRDFSRRTPVGAHAQSKRKGETILHPDEQEVVDLLAEVWNKFIKLRELHNDDLPEFRHAIHRAQYIVMARPVKELYV